MTEFTRGFQQAIHLYESGATCVRIAETAKARNDAIGIGMQAGVDAIEGRFAKVRFDANRQGLDPSVTEELILSSLDA